MVIVGRNFIKNIKPTFIKENISNIISERKIMHIIEERDR